MAKDGSEATTHVGVPSGARSEAVPVEARLADAAFELLDCHDEGQVYTVAGDFLSLLIPRAIVIVNEAEPGLEHFVTRYVAGLDSTTLGKAADFAGFSIIGKRSAVSHALADQLLGSRLDRVEGGFPELASSEIPVAAGKVAVKAFGLSDTYTIGISDAHNTLGNIHIITRSPGTAIPVSLVESFARHCYSALESIRRGREIQSSAETVGQLLGSMSEGLAVHEAVFDDSGKVVDFVLVDVNPAFEQLMGVSADEVVGRHVTEVFPWVDDNWIRRYGAVATTGISAHFEEEHAGTYLDVAAYCPRPRRFAALLSDVTDRKLFEQALQRRLAGLTDPSVDPSDVSFHDLFDLEEIQSLQDAFASATGVASLIVEPDGTPITNPSNFCRLCEAIIRGTDKGLANCRRSDIAIGGQGEDGPIISPCLSGGLWDAGAQITAGGAHVASWLVGQVLDETRDEGVLLAYADEIGADRAEFLEALREVPTMSKERFELVANTLYLFANELSVIAYQNVQQARFIVERERAEAALKLMNESLEERVDARTRELNETVAALTAASEAKTRFLRSMSHELRTPLNSIIGFSTVLANGMAGPLNPEQGKQIAMVRSSGEHLLALINDILDLSRIEAGATPVHLETVDVGGVLNEVMGSVHHIAQRKGLQLSLELDHPEPELVSDQTKVEQVLLNMLSNAIKFTDSGFVVLKGFTPSAGQVAFSVVDTGRGIPSAELERIFGEFEQGGRNDPSQEGTGLGLAISRGLAKALGGTLTATSRVDVGSTFTLTLPARPEQDVAPMVASDR